MGAKRSHPLIDLICLKLCDGYEGRCQRYPNASESCEDFIKFRKGFEAGRKEGIKETIIDIEELFEPTVPMAIDYTKWRIYSDDKRTKSPR